MCRKRSAYASKLRVLELQCKDMGTPPTWFDCGVGNLMTTVYPEPRRDNMHGGERGVRV